MVNSRVNIAQVFENIKELNAEQIEHLNVELASKPWCSAYRMLLAKGYDSQGSYLKNKTLRLAATYAGDREQLFALIYNQEVVWKGEHKTVEKEKKVEVIEIEEPIVEEENEPEEELVAEVEAIERPAVEEEQVAEISEVAETEDITETIAENVKLTAIEQEEPELEAESKKEKIDFDKIVTYDPLEQLKPNDKRADKERVSLPFDFVAYDPEKELSKLIEDKKEAQNGGQKDFLYWLNTVKDDPDAEPKEESSVEVVQNLLDKFLATKREKRLKPASFYKAEIKAEESDTDNMDIISETLLELYVKQGHYSKAVVGYEKLSLLNPTKSTYFAARIKEIKNLEKDQ